MIGVGLSLGNSRTRAREPEGSIRAQTRVLSLRGKDATLVPTKKIRAEGGSVEFLGWQIETPGIFMSAACGTVGVSGQAASLVRAKKLPAQAGEMTLAGQSTLQALTVNAEVGALIRTGQDAGLRAARTLLGSAGAYDLAGQAATFSIGDGDAAALIARMTTAPDETRQGHIQTLISALKAAGVWSELDALYVLAAHTAQAARLNWKSSTGNLTTANGPTFTTDRGYTGDGSTAYLSSGLYRNALTNYQQDSASLFCWVLTDVASGTQYDCGFETSQACINARNGSNGLNVRINGSSSGVGGVMSSIGFWGGTRSSSSAVEIWANTSEASDTNTSQALGAEEWHICRGGPNYSTRQIAIAGIGGDLTGKRADIRSAFLTYLQAVGAMP